MICRDALRETPMFRLLNIMIKGQKSHKKNIYVMSYKRSVPQLMFWKTNENDRNNGKSMAIVRMNDTNVEYIKNIIHNSPRILKIKCSKKVDFEEITKIPTKKLSDDTGYVSDSNEHDTDHAEKFVAFPEIRALCEQPY